MNRRTVAFGLAILLGGYVFLLGWAGQLFFSHAKGQNALLVNPLPVRELPLGETVDLRLQGRGFDEQTRVSVRMDVNNQEAIVGSFPLGGVSNDMLIVGDILYLASTSEGFRIFDISNPLKPVFLSRPVSHVTVLDIEKNGEKLYLSCGAQGVRIYELADQRLRYVKNIYMRALAIESRAVDGFLYVAGGKEGSFVYDLDDASGMQPVATFGSGFFVTGISTYENFVYLATRGDGVQIYRLDVPGSQVHVGQLSAGRTARDAKVFQGKLYVLEQGKVSVYDLKEPAYPVLIQESQPVFPWKLFFSGETVYIADGFSGIHLVAEDQWSNANSWGYISVGSNPRAMAESKGYLYVAATNGWLKVVKRRAVLPRQVIASIRTPKFVNDIFIRNHWMYIADHSGGTYLLDLRDYEKKLVRLGADRATSFAVDENHLFVAKTAAGIEVLDIIDPGQPQLLAAWPDLERPVSLAVVDHYLVSASGAKGVALIDISDYAEPAVLDRITNLHAMDVTAADGLIYVAGIRKGLQIFRISEQGKLQLLSQAKQPFPIGRFAKALAVKVSNNIAFVANGRGGLLVVDVKNPRSPRILSAIDLPGIARGLLVDGPSVYVSCGSGGLFVVDARDLKAPVLVSSMELHKLAGGIALVDGLLYLANGYMGVTAVPVPEQLKKVDFVSAEQLQVTLPSPAFPGRYSLQVTNRKTTVSLDGVLEYR
ncbi:MAG: hypothetical protein GQ578_04465 [Desulfuromonadaceae bacterium]|nr:hypothetical protein [Desulfuromonadaceae bacterium]